jgi:hypothetical protein
MTTARQQMVTRRQVRLKRDEAFNRANEWMNRALDAKSSQEYDECVRSMNRAASDCQTWQKVLDALTR